MIKRYFSPMHYAIVAVLCYGMVALHAAPPAPSSPLQNRFHVYFKNETGVPLFCTITNTPKDPNVAKTEEIQPGAQNTEPFVVHKRNKVSGRIRATNYLLASVNPAFIKPGGFQVDFDKPYFSKRFPQYLSTNCAGPIVVTVKKVKRGKEDLLQFSIDDTAVNCESFSNTRAGIKKAWNKLTGRTQEAVEAMPAVIDED